jgi:hypothetical protein
MTRMRPCLSSEKGAMTLPGQTPTGWSEAWTLASSSRTALQTDKTCNKMNTSAWASDGYLNCRGLPTMMTSLLVCMHRCKAMCAQGLLQMMCVGHNCGMVRGWHTHIVTSYARLPLTPIGLAPGRGQPGQTCMAAACSQSVQLLVPRLHLTAEPSSNGYTAVQATLLSTAAVGAMIVASELAAKAIAHWRQRCSRRTRRQYYALPARLMSGRARSVADLASPARTKQCRLRHVRRHTYRWVTGYRIRQYKGGPSIN